jgi:hypothetical protein
MANLAAGARPTGAAKALAVLSVAGFWALPFAPVVAIGAVKSTEGTEGWARRAAVAGALLCIAYTMAMTAAFAALVFRLLPA